MQRDVRHGRGQVPAQVLQGQFQDRSLRAGRAVDGLIAVQLALGVGGRQGCCAGGNGMDPGEDLATLAGEVRPHDVEPRIGDDLAPEGLPGHEASDVALAQSILRLAKAHQGRDRGTGMPRSLDERRLRRHGCGPGGLRVQRRRPAAKDQGTRLNPTYKGEGPGLHAGSARKALGLFDAGSAEFRCQGGKGCGNIDFHDVGAPRESWGLDDLPVGGWACNSSTSMDAAQDRLTEGKRHGL